MKNKINLNAELELKLKNFGADFVCFVNVTSLSNEQNRGYCNAILFGIALSKNYINHVANTPNYVKKRIKNNFDFSDDELYLTELKIDEISDQIANLLISENYKAYSLSDKNQIATGSFDGKYGKTILPHKTIATLAGIGWIGKNNLLVTEKFGSAICLGVVLTDAPLNTISNDTIKSKCGDCDICLEVCESKALKGQIWNTSIQREDMIDVKKCTTCINCLVFCPYTQKYLKTPDTL